MILSHILSGPESIQTENGRLVATQIFLQKWNGSAFVNLNRQELINGGCSVQWSIDQAANGMFFCTNWNTQNNSCNGISTLTLNGGVTPFRLLGTPNNQNIFTSIWLVTPAVSFFYRVGIFCQIFSCSNSAVAPTGPNAPNVIFLRPNGFSDQYISLLPPVVNSVGNSYGDFPIRCTFEILGKKIVNCGESTILAPSRVSTSTSEQYIYSIDNPLWDMQLINKSVVIKAPSARTVLMNPTSNRAFLSVTRTEPGCEDFTRTVTLVANCNGATILRNRFGRNIFATNNTIIPYKYRNIIK